MKIQFVRPTNETCFVIPHTCKIDFVSFFASKRKVIKMSQGKMIMTIKMGKSTVFNTGKIAPFTYNAICNAFKMGNNLFISLTLKRI